MASFEWLPPFPKMMVRHLNMKALDHILILIKMQGEEETQRRPFRFPQAWTTNCSNFRVIKEAW